MTDRLPVYDDAIVLHDVKAISCNPVVTVGDKEMLKLMIQFESGRAMKIKLFAKDAYVLKIHGYDLQGRKR